LPEFSWSLGVLDGEYGDQLSEGDVAEAWKQWEGQAVSAELRLGPYLGGSPRGAVFKLLSDDPNLQSAAIKLIAQESPFAENRFASWRFASTLSHPNLIRIFQSGRCQIGDARLLYVVMELADEDLSQIIPRRPLTEIEARELLPPVLDALEYLHANGLVHGSIQPANIMASGEQLKLSGDGIRRIGDAINDPGDYDPPESVSSTAGDVWSLGMTLVEILTQRLPTWDRDAAGEPETPKSLRAPLFDIALNCLRRDPARRWTMTQIAERLRPAVTAAQRIEAPVPREAAPGNTRYLIAAMILFLASTGFASWKLLIHPSREDARVSHVTPKPAKRNLPEPRAVDLPPTPPEKKPAVLSDERTPVGGVAPNPAAATPAPKPVAVAPAPAPKIPALTQASSGVVHQVLPDVTQKSLGTIRGTVRVAIAVSVDSSGHVSDATIDSQGPSAYFANVALEVARQWKFAPGRAGTWTVHFEFSPDGVKASADPSGP
jgi:TonB family protein